MKAWLAIVAVVCVAPQGLTWTQVKPEGGGFVISFPGTPQYSEQTVATLGAGGIVLRQWSLELTDREIAFFASYNEIPANLISTPADIETRLDGAVQGTLNRLPAGSILTSTSRIEIAGYPGREGHFEIPSAGLVYRQRYFLVGTRFYQLNAGTMKARLDAVAADIDRFMNSFALIAR